MPCHVGHHYVVCLFAADRAVMLCFDPVWHRISAESRVARERELAPLRLLLPRLLRASRWFDNCTADAAACRWIDQYTMDFAAGDDVYRQKDSKSCGVFCCMQVERLISGGPTPDWAHVPTNIDRYRLKIASCIFGLCTPSYPDQRTDE